MAKQFHLQPLLELAQQRSEDAAKELMRLKQAWQEAEFKLSQLKLYLGEYQSRLLQSTQNGLGIHQWRDYQAFIVKLETAIKVQKDEIERCRLGWERGQLEWQARERDVKAYDALRLRHHHAEMAKEERIEQRQQDEFARNLHHRKNHVDD